tara:strand:- start:251 stop:1393 length:1143 start_codon:yes stop_codon:yes gene_type:complete
MNRLKLLDLFSGIGGFSLAMESTGFFETIAFCEKDNFCQKVLRKHWNDIKIYDDIRNINGADIQADIITGGFPCQPFSVAGKRRGTEDDRYLWDETIRVITECKPRWFIGENVEGIINIQDGMVLRQVQTDLEEQGFQVQCLVIPAASIGAWHQRKRVWIIATNANNYGSYRSQGDATKQSCNEQKDRLSFGDDKDVPNTDNARNRTSKYDFERKEQKNNYGWERQPQFESSGHSKNVSNTDSNLRKWGGAEQSSGANEVWKFCVEKEEQARNDIRSKTIGYDAVLGKEDVSDSNSKRSQGFGLQSDNLQEGNKTTISSDNSSKEQQTWWQTQSKLCGVPYGISYELDKGRANRIKSLGNSIVPQIAREIGLAIYEAEKE